MSPVDPLVCAVAEQKDFKKSIMVGDSISDIEFAKNANMFAVLIGQSEKYFCTDSLISLSKLL